MSTTQIQQRQIASGAIADAQVQAGAAIASSKLADGGNFIKKDGSVTMTGALNAGSNQINAVATPSISTDAANKGYVDTAISNLQQMFVTKGAVRVAATSNVTISAPGTAIDGVTLSSGDRVLLTAQTTSSQNGIYTFATSASAMTRSTDMDAWSEVLGALVSVESEGTSNKNTVWLATVAPGGTIGTTSISFITVGVATGLANTNFVNNETPSGSINGSNTSFTLANTPVTGSEQIFINGVLGVSGSGNDYVISGSSITMQYALATGEVLRANYRK